MNKNVMGIILIVAAVVLVGFYAWPKLKPYFASPPPQSGMMPGEPGMPGGPGGPMKPGAPAPAVPGK